jgi:hypothetical protein
VVELPVEDVGLCPLGFNIRASTASAFRNGGNPVLTHAPCHTVPATPLTVLSEVDEDPRATVHAIALIPEVPDLSDQPLILTSSP